MDIPLDGMSRTKAKKVQCSEIQQIVTPKTKMSMRLKVTSKFEMKRNDTENKQTGMNLRSNMSERKRDNAKLLGR